MSLRITRAANTRIFLGENLEQQNMSGTATDTIWIRRVESSRKEQSALLNIRNSDGVVETTLGMGEGYPIRDGVEVKLKGISDFWTNVIPFCKVCGRGDRHDVSGSPQKRLIAQAKLEVSAPNAVKIFRDDIVSGERNE